ncbi:flagellum-specific ATP synthase [Ferrimonas marina]|uniref:Flagellum-specific ATP synthase n=1 Tax=Ferrimonas marina TaxID=299255 RepID=A0A1M5TDS0_9GAMM|nr:flagellum-specific ATP synthase [Ferrimonas marina]
MLDRFARASIKLGVTPPATQVGRLSSTSGMVLRVSGVQGTIGSRYLLKAGCSRVPADLVAFTDGQASLLPIAYVGGLRQGGEVELVQEQASVLVGQGLLGRVVDCQCHPIDDLGVIGVEGPARLVSAPISPLKRGVIDEPLDVGVRAINGLMTIGKGQRVGLFAGTGVGKSVLLSMMAKNTAADIVVIGLIGERGREVKEFVERTLSPEARKRSVIVAAPADEPPLARLQAAQTCTAIAEWFRDRGHNVLMIMDSLTRFAQAQREVALSLGEPPASKGYPPSVFSMIPQLVERAGKMGAGGSITAIYTVLTENDDPNDPVADAARGVLDGHILLSREMAAQGVYPAIDVPNSLSRVMPDVTAPNYLDQAVTIRRLYADYINNRDLIQVGAYKHGTDANVDLSIAAHPELIEFIRQRPDEPVSVSESQERISQLSQKYRLRQ